MVQTWMASALPLQLRMDTVSPLAAAMSSAGRDKVGAQAKAVTLPPSDDSAASRHCIASGLYRQICTTCTSS